MSGAFGQRPPFKVNEVKDSVDAQGKKYRVFHCQAGFWEGPSEPGRNGRYVTTEFTVDERFPQNSVSPNVSFWADLIKAIKGKS